MIDLNHDKLPDPVAEYEEKLARHMEEINGRLKDIEKLIYDYQAKQKAEQEAFQQALAKAEASNKKQD